PRDRAARIDQRPAARRGRERNRPHQAGPRGQIAVAPCIDRSIRQRRDPMEMETYDTNELYRLDEAIRSTMDTIRRSPQFGGGFGGGFGWQSQAGWQPGQNVERIADAIRERVISGVRERVADRVREQIRHTLRERIAETLRQQLGTTLREELRQMAMQPGYPVESVVERVRERVAQEVRDRIAETMKERIVEAIRENL